jgi:hypothetical protein
VRKSRAKKVKCPSSLLLFREFREKELAEELLLSE